MQEEALYVFTAIGITAEYNPFHNGHRWQLQTLREKSGNVPVIACMSGWVVQRGEMAAADPWIRASMAVHAGVDLVVLLPAWYSLRSADYFAAGAVKTLAATGIVDTLVCGAEHTCTASSSLSSAAAWSLLPETEQQIKTLLQQGLSYGAAWETAASRSQKDAGWFKGANNLLALAYQKALLNNHLEIELITLPRQGSGYNDTELRPPYASASAIRTALRRLTQRCFRHRTGPFPAGYFPRFVTVPGNQLPCPLLPTGRNSVLSVVRPARPTGRQLPV